MPLELDTRQRAMLLEMGVRVWLAIPPPGTAPSETPPATALPPKPVPAPTPVPRPVPTQALPTTPTTPAASTTMDVHTMDWPELVHAAANCQVCGLCAGRKNSTLSAPESTKITETAVSARQADWFILGDPPNAEEDRLGQPFAAEDGRLLDNMLKAVGVSRHGSGAQGAYLSNIVKCRPPHGRAPQTSELSQCTMYLQREMELLRPKVILVTGRRAAQTLLGVSSAQAALPLDKQRGTIHHYRDIPLVITYPLQTLRRTTALKAGAWADVCLAADVIAGKAP